MNVFILCTGRCGSTTFTKANEFITNYTSGHETRTAMLNSDRLLYPKSHIEADNRLSWMLGRLDEEYGDSAIYVHLQRDVLKTAQSFAKRWDFGIMKAYRQQILMGLKSEKMETEQKLEVCLDYCYTVNKNIEHFLSDKSKTMNFNLENSGSDFTQFWDLIGAKGDQTSALNEWQVAYNKSN